MNNCEVNVKNQVSPFYAFFLIHAMQTGISVLSFQKFLVKRAGTDGWISILLAGMMVHLFIAVIYKIFSMAPGDIVSVNKHAIGKYAGHFFSLLFAVYFFLMSAAVMTTYINVVHVWMFAQVPSWAFAIVFMALIYYIIAGGFRAVTGITFISVILVYWLVFILFYDLFFSEFANLLPMFDHPIKDIIMGIQDSSLTMLGFETLLVFYPFLQHPETSQKSAHLGALTTTLLAMTIYLVSIIYYSPKELVEVIWPTLSLSSIIELPFIQRFEYIQISWWALVIIPNMTIPLWAASRIVKKVFSVKQIYPLLAMFVLILLSQIFVLDKDMFVIYEKAVNQFGPALLFMYLPVLLGIVYWKKKRGKQT
ncbi:GerAB/ArcD/ProY family transporter [Bacillus massiliglaciei]|uniref:GerAB/ArcD/ProY family transporter n=1 Tax=Bacillus massiliglaciei TaxID=1816693 RepID=UPI000A979B73|nr:GerAB/ArcD/ProY family transporter [Bacillus massiliglaciei]